MLLISSLLLAGLAAASPAAAAPEAAAGPAAADWRLVAAYDASSTLAQTGLARPEFVWQEVKGMRDACGPAKAPMGLGINEAAAIALGNTPALALVLERVSDQAAPLGPDNLRVALGPGVVLLQPAVEPRSLMVHIRSAGSAHELLRATQLVETQLAMELCLEHKTGRAWLGQDQGRLRQAFLLDVPDGGRADRMYFGGQRDPVPALLGPPDACLVREAKEDSTGPVPGGRGESTLSLVPSDVWGASLRWCAADAVQGTPDLDATPSLPLRLTGEAAGGAASRSRLWQQLDVVVSAQTEDSAPTLSVLLDGQTLVPDAPVFAGDKIDAGLTDILAAVPLRYPTLARDDAQYTVLLVPNWQIVEGLRRLAEGHPDLPMPTDGGALRDGVTWVLQHPDLLSVQVPTAAGLGEKDWYDLASTVHPEGRLSAGWGFTTGLLASRSPVALATVEPAAWDGAALAQRALPQSLFLAGFAVLGLLGIAGARRLPELWMPMPEERANYWPGLPQEAEAVPEAPEATAVKAP